MPKTEAYQDKGCLKPVRLEFHVQDVGAEHDDAAGVAFFTGGGEIKQETTPDPNAAILVALEPESAQIHGIVQQQDVHGFAVAPGGLEDKILDGFGPPPVPGGETGEKEPDECAQGQGRGNPVGCDD